MVTIVYALVGIPLTFLYLSNIGNFLADCFRMFYKKICCDLCCCQKCERKKKRERMRLKKQREWAAQRNSVLKATAASNSLRYTLSSDSSVHVHENALADDLDSLGEVIVLPGQPDDDHNNVIVGAHVNDVVVGDEGDDSNKQLVQIEEGCLGGCPSSSSPAAQNSANDEQERWQDFPDDLRETAILGDDVAPEVDEFGNVIKETAILDSDTDNEGGGVKNSNSTNFGALSNPDRRQSLFNKLDDAKETAILDDSDDEVFTNENIILPIPQTTVEEKPTKTLDKKSKSSSEGSKKSRSKSAKERATSPKKEEITQPKSALKKGSVKGKRKDRSRSTEKDKSKSDSTSSNKEKDTLSPTRAVSLKGSTSSTSSDKKGKHKPSKKLKRKETSSKKSKKDKDGKKSKKSKSKSSSAEVDLESRNIIEDEFSGGDAGNSDDESFVTARAESASVVGEDGDAINDAYQGDVIMQQPRGIVTIATQDGVVKYDPDSVAIDVGTNSPYDTVELMDFQELSAAQASALGYVDVDYNDEEEDEKVTVPISICLIIIAGYIFGGSMLFALWEDWDYLTGSYFCFITLSTIGFGDIVPGTDMQDWGSSEKLVLCAMWLAFGLSLLAMCFNLMQEEVKDKCKWVGTKLGILKDDDEG